ncbi:MAG: alkyl sulfatase dimerization domain-containing protein [Actinomycetota bacterium]
MAEDLIELADRMWRGEADVPGLITVSNELTEVADDVAFVWSMANVSAFATDAGLVLIDTGSAFMAGNIHQAVRGWTQDPLHTAVYSHGHIDHVFGVRRFEDEGPRARVVAHEAMPARFDRYVLTNGYNSIINERQFGLPNVPWPKSYRYPDETYRDLLTLEVGGETFELHHARGETDDHTWTWIPNRKVLCTGDFFIWASPNAGNPQKVQRYPREWAVALQEMAALGAEVLLPGHGVPIFGAERIREALTDTAELLQSIHDQTVALMNDGASLDTILRTVKMPRELLEKPYLRPTYDDPEFIVHNVWRQYGGWWDGDPATLKPAPNADLAAELAQLTGGADKLAGRARELADEGRLRLAGHLAEFAALASEEEHATRAEINERRAQQESSVMAKGIFGSAARESRARGQSPGARPSESQ